MARKTLDELRQEAVKAVATYSETYNSDSILSVVNEAKEKADEAISAYNTEAICLKYHEWLNADNPVITAITELYVGVIKIKTNKDSETNTVTYSVEDAQRMVDLIALDERAKEVGKDITAVHTWKYKAEKFNKLSAFRTAMDLKQDTKALEKSYFISQKAAEIDMGKTPTSNTQMLKQLQEVIDCIIYEDNGKGANTYKASSHDVAYILAVMNRRASSGVVALPKTSTMVTLITDILHRIFTNGVYEVEYQAKKNASTQG